MKAAPTAHVEKRAFPREEPRVKAPLGELDLTCALLRAMAERPGGAAFYEIDTDFTDTRRQKERDAT